MREQYKYSLWTPCKTLQYRKVGGGKVGKRKGTAFLPFLYGIERQVLPVGPEGKNY